MYFSPISPGQNASVNKPQKHTNLIIEEDTIYELDEECLKNHCKKLPGDTPVKIIPEELPDAPAKF